MRKANVTRDPIESDPRLGAPTRIQSDSLTPGIDGEFGGGSRPPGSENVADRATRDEDQVGVEIALESDALLGLVGAAFARIREGRAQHE